MAKLIYFGGLVIPLLLYGGCAAPAAMNSDLREAALTWEGTPYEPGGSDLGGIDGVGLVRLLFQELYAIELPLTVSRITNAGEEVERNALRSGDILIMKLSSGISHLGIYLGRNEFLHVPVEKGVIIDRIDSGDWTAAFQGARRMDISGSPSSQASRPDPAPSTGRRTGW